MAKIRPNSKGGSITYFGAPSPPPSAEKGETQEQITRLTQLMIGVIIVLFIGFVTMFATVGTLVWNAHMWGRDTYQTLIKELNDNNNKIDSLTNEINILQSSQKNNCNIPIVK